MWRFDEFAPTGSGTLGLFDRAAASGTEDLLAAAARLVGLILVAWLLATTLASLARRTIPSLRRVEWLDALTAPAIRRILDRALVVSLGLSALVGQSTAGAATFAGEGSQTPPTAARLTSTPRNGRAYVVMTPDGGFEIQPSAGSGREPSARGERAPAAVGESRRGESLVVRAPEPSPDGRETGPTGTDTPAAEASESEDTATDAPAPRTYSPGGAAPDARDRHRRGRQVSDRAKDRRSSRSIPMGITEAAVYTVEAGDSLWTIAERRMHEALPDAGSAEVAHYWARLVDANRESLRSGNPSLIFPGEIVELPMLRGDGG